MCALRDWLTDVARTCELTNALPVQRAYAGKLNSPEQSNFHRRIALKRAHIGFSTVLIATLLVVPRKSHLTNSTTCAKRVYVTGICNEFISIVHRSWDSADNEILACLTFFGSRENTSSGGISSRGPSRSVRPSSLQPSNVAAPAS